MKWKENYLSGRTMVKRLFLVIIFIQVMSLFGEDSFSLGIAWLGSSSMSEELTRGTMELFSELAPDLRVEIQGGLPNRQILEETLQRFAQEKDGVALFRSSGAKYLSENPQPIPSFIGAVNHPVELNIMTNTERPGENITGVSYFIDFDKIIGFIRNLIPDLQSILLFYEENHPGSEVDLNFIEKACNEASLTLYAEGCTDYEQVDKIFSEYQGKIEAVVFGNQDFFNRIPVSELTLLNEIPTFSLNSQLVSRGVLASLSANHRKLGRLLAGSILKVLYEGRNPGDIPIQFDKDPKIYINMKTSENLELIIPLHMLRVAEVTR